MFVKVKKFLQTVERFQAVIALVVVGATGAWMIRSELGSVPSKQDLKEIKADVLEQVDLKHSAGIAAVRAQGDATMKAIDELKREQETIRREQREDRESTRLALRSLNDKLFQLATILRKASSERSPDSIEAVSFWGGK